MGSFGTTFGKWLLSGAAGAALLLVTGSSAQAQYGTGFYYNNPQVGFQLQIGRPSYGYGNGGYQGYHGSYYRGHHGGNYQWHDTSHFDRHGNHYHYHPGGHYDYIPQGHGRYYHHGHR